MIYGDAADAASLNPGKGGATWKNLNKEGINKDP